MSKKKEKIVRYSSEDLKKLKSRTDWEKVDALTDKEIERAIDQDSDAAPRLDANWFKEAVWMNFNEASEEKERITIRLDKDVIEYFREKGKGYQSRINNALRAFVQAQQENHP